MTTATFNQPANSLRSYIADVSKAARAFTSALFAARERQFVAQAVAAKPAVMSERTREKSRRQLFSLASQFESTSPNLAAELLSLASRG
jgi:hypothetical protein